MFTSTFKGLLVVATVIAGLLTAAAPPALAAADHGSLGLISYNGHAGLGASYTAVSKSSVELVQAVTDTDDPDSAAIVTNNNDPDSMAVARGSRDRAAYQHNHSDLEHV